MVNFRQAIGGEQYIEASFRSSGGCNNETKSLGIANQVAYFWVTANTGVFGLSKAFSGTNWTAGCIDESLFSV